MSKYKVIVAFSDLTDNNYIYRPGDDYPRAGKDVSIDRITSLSGKDNKRGIPLIEFINDEDDNIPFSTPLQQEPSETEASVEISNDDKGTKQSETNETNDTADTADTKKRRRQKKQ